MTEYKENEILKLIVRLLKKLKTNVGFPPYEYEIFLYLDPEEALKQLSFRLRRLRDIERGTKKGFQSYFSTKNDYLKFLAESILAESLNDFFALKKENISAPPLNDEGDLCGVKKVFFIEKINMNPFKEWRQACKEQGKKTIRATTT